MLKSKIKLILPLVFIALITIIVILLCLKKPKQVLVTTVKTPYNVLSDINTNDEIQIKLYVNQTKSYFTDIDKIVSSSITSNDTHYKTKIKEIIDGKEIVLLHNEKYYLYYYNVLFDYKFLSEYSDVLNEAYLNIDFSNGITSNIRIGSLSIYKYDSASTNDISHIVLTTLKPILKERDSDESKLCGIELGLRSTNNMDNITVNNIELLDANVSNLGNFKEVEKDSINNINDAYNNYPNVINNDSEVDLKANNLTTIVTPIIYNESITDYNIGTFGLKITYTIDENGVKTDYDYYVNHFMFYNYHYKVSEDNLEFYEYEFK